jgi:hypothetical protein
VSVTLAEGRQCVAELCTAIRRALQQLVLRAGSDAILLPPPLVGWIWPQGVPSSLSTGNLTRRGAATVSPSAIDPCVVYTAAVDVAVDTAAVDAAVVDAASLLPCYPLLRRCVLICAQGMLHKGNAEAHEHAWLLLDALCRCDPVVHTALHGVMEEGRTEALLWHGSGSGSSSGSGSGSVSVSVSGSGSGRNKECQAAVRQVEGPHHASFPSTVEAAGEEIAWGSAKEMKIPSLLEATPLLSARRGSEHHHPAQPSSQLRLNCTPVTASARSRRQLMRTGLANRRC